MTGTVEMLKATPEAHTQSEPPLRGFGIGRRAVSGVLWSSISRLAQQSIQFAISVVLARLLVPQEFGLVAEVGVFTSFASVLVDFGFSAALIQREKLEERHLASAFWVNVSVGLVLTIVMVALSPLIAAFYHEPRLTTLTMGMSSSFLLGSIGIVQTTLLERELNFRRLAAITNASTFTGGLAAVGAALAGFGPWSIALLGPAVLGLRSLLLWHTSSWRPRRMPDGAAIRDLWSFSANVAAFNAVNFWARNADNLLVGRFVTPHALGIYSRAYSLMLLPLNQITSTVSVSMYPVVARLQGDVERFRSAYLRLVAIVALFSFPMAIGLFVAARPFILTFFGERWEGAVPVLQILCLPLLLQSVASSVGLIYQTCARTDWMFKWGVAASALTVASFAIGIHWGIIGVATAYAVVSVVMVYFNFSVPGRLIGMRSADILRVVWEPLIAASCMAVLVWLAGRAVGRLGSPIELTVEVVVGIVAYSIMVYRLSPQAFLDVRRIFRRDGLLAKGQD